MIFRVTVCHARFGTRLPNVIERDISPTTESASHHLDKHIVFIFLFFELLEFSGASPGHGVDRNGFSAKNDSQFRGRD